MASQGFEALSRERVARARELAEAHPEAREVLEFYIAVVEFQNTIEDTADDLSQLISVRPRLVDLVLARGPDRLREEAQGLDEATLTAAIEDFSKRRDTTSARSFFARVLLEVQARKRPGPGAQIRADNLCPHCSHRAQLGVLRPEGEGNALTLLCSLCTREWSFPRLICPACGERDEKKLPGYSAGEFAHLRIEACESCGSYLKHIDLSREPRAVGPVDELAALSLDVWARNEGLEKIQPNLAGI